MEKNYIHFVREIYSYCDNKLGEKVLFPAFVNLWNNNSYITKKDLVVLTSKIISRLLNKNILMKTSQKSGFDNGYELYKILPHENLVRHDDLVERKMKLLR